MAAVLVQGVLGRHEGSKEATAEEEGHHDGEAGLVGRLEGGVLFEGNKMDASVRLDQDWGARITMDSLIQLSCKSEYCRSCHQTFVFVNL